MAFPTHASRPLFVPPGIPVVRTGPTTRAEYERLLDHDEPEHSQIRPSAAVRVRGNGLLQVVADVLHLTPRTPRSRR
jgi:hypothetical protein